MVSKVAGGFVAVLGVLAALFALHLVTAPFPQWPLWACLILGGLFLIVLLAAQARPPDGPADDDSGA